MLRTISRNEKSQDVLLKGGKLACTCGDAVFTGIPCRHMLSLASKQEGIGYENLPFNPVWKKSYYIEKHEDKEPERAQEEEEEKKIEENQRMEEQNLNKIDILEKEEIGVKKTVRKVIFFRNNEYKHFRLQSLSTAKALVDLPLQVKEPLQVKGQLVQKKQLKKHQKRENR